MYLKSIEVHGFKSFANKIMFEFHDGITAIVGPNGSGKSNVADAVRWVLGEQKVKQLRSTSMQDVIFAGTQNRKPLSFAWVAITFDNSDHSLAIDYEEVTVARRVYRSGESEYLMNGHACRLRDIQELFYDTGIGKEGYSIIGQGQIDRILSGRPEDRRELFDEAAGIVKYKRRRRAAEKKLENERQNLERVNDILAELEKQLGPLKRQSETARIYLNRRDELRTYDVNRFLLETEDARSRREKLEENLAAAKMDHENAQREFRKIRDGYEKTEKQTENLETELEKLRNEQSECAVLREKTEGQIGILREQIRTAKLGGEHQAHRLTIIADELAEYNGQKEEFLRQQDDFKQEVESITIRKNRRYEEMEQIRSRIAACETEIGDCQEESIVLLKEKAERQAEDTRLKTLFQQAQNRAEELEEMLGEAGSLGSVREENLNAVKQELSDITGRLENLCAQEAKIEHKLDVWKQKSAETSAALETAKQNYHKDTSRLESLRNIAERYDGYGNSIRRVMEQKENIPGICGVVADLLKVEQKYETAVETALGGSIQNIVTEEEKTAKELITFLKKHRYGRATFLPLTSVRKRGGAVQDEVLRESGVIGTADRLVRTESRYRGIAGYLLGRTVVVDGIDHAVSLQRKYRYSLRIVTLEGELLQPGGSMTGGAFKNSSNLLGRSREIAALQKIVREEKEILDTSETRLEDIRTARELLKEDLAEVRAKMQDCRIELNSAQMKLVQEEEAVSQREQEKNNTRREQEELSAQLEQIRAQRERLRQDEEAAGRRQEEVDARSEHCGELLDELNETYRTRQNRQSEILMEEAAVRQKADYLQENIARIEAETAKLTAEKEEIMRSSGEQEKKIASLETGIGELQEELSRAGHRQEELETQMRGLQEQKETFSAAHREYFEKREKLSAEISDLDKEIYRLNSQREKLTESMETQTARLWDDYELTPHAAAQLRNPELKNLTAIKKQTAALREEIRGLGNVNVNAIEEYKEVSERCAFMDEQRNDILASEEALLKIIADLEAGMQKQFAEKFADIQKEFDRAFKELFGGGSGTLELMENEDLLESGIQIIAQPPGKKLQNMMQLSGGEKALTAIALLFAIQNLKPSPFCLLDEIEAALDDSNVTRFASYLRKLSENTQFILITHRRGTMMAADRLYGVTMQEKGVSALVSVDLIEKQLDD